MTGYISPDCRDGEHVACLGLALAEEYDRFMLCNCPCHDNKEEA